ncbi:hypothetical protein, partial [Thermococcus sp.]|uniref:hypothetical protein n=1 Tax=Thermococcus sp. TaxID=35749 RepID=UPI0026180857
MDYTTGEIIGQKSLQATMKLPEPCLHPETKLWTSKGLKPAADVKVGDVLLDGSVVTAAYALPYLKPWVEIKVAHWMLPITVTENHPFLVWPGRKCPYYNNVWCKPTTKCPTGKACSYKSEAKLVWKRAKDLKPGDFVALSVESPPPVSNELQRWGLTHEDGYILGWLLGDGYVRYVSKRGGRFEFYLGPNDPVDDLIGLLRKRTENKVATQRRGKLTTITYADARNAKWVRPWLYPNGKKQFPMEILGAPEEFRRGVYEGLVASDGCWCKGKRHPEKRVMLGTTSEAFAQFMFLLASSLGKFPGITHYSAPNTGFFTGLNRTMYLVEVFSRSPYRFSASGLRFHRVKEVHENVRSPQWLVNLETDTGIIPLPFISHNSAWINVRKLVSPPGRIGARSLKDKWGYMTCVDLGLV